jgi:hypothetical protein
MWKNTTRHLIEMAPMKCTSIFLSQKNKHMFFGGNKDPGTCNSIWIQLQHFPTVAIILFSIELMPPCFF